MNVTHVYTTDAMIVNVKGEYEWKGIKNNWMDEKPCDVCRLIWKRIELREKVHQSDWV